MFDRRVVRGNTFAALVVPTSLQPDPALVERENEQREKRNAEIEEMRRRRHDEEEKRQTVEVEQEMPAAEEEEQWDRLSNEDEALRPSEIPPDFYVDRPKTPEFIPNEKGIDKETQVVDTELFDFELEVEPILQVLVGKSCENARIEVVEEWEQDQLDGHKKRFLQIKEAELMETQRMEAARNRRRREMERRALQHRTAKDQKYRESLKTTARNKARELLSSIRRDTFSELRDQGILRDPRQHSLINFFLPALEAQTEVEMKRRTETGDDIDGFNMQTLRQTSRSHKDAILKEKKRLSEKREEERRIQKEKEEAKRKRREARAAERERRRVLALSNGIIADLVNPATVADAFKPEHRVYDVRDPSSQEGGVFVIGGMVSEFLLTFACLHDYIMANPANTNFEFTPEIIQNFLKELLIGMNFPDGAITLRVAEQDGEGEEAKMAEAMTPDELVSHCLTLKYIDDFGLKFFLEMSRDLGISKDLLKALYDVIVASFKGSEEQQKELPAAP